MLNIASDVNHNLKNRFLTPKDVMNDVALCVWVADAQPGTTIVYYSGHLSRDRQMHSEGYPEPVRRKIGELGNVAWMLGDENWVHLIQRRVSMGCWEYIAVRRAERPKQKPVYRIIQSLAAHAPKEKRSPDALNATATGPPA